MVAFINNITFHPVPEPSAWLLLSLGIAGGGDDPQEAGLQSVILSRLLRAGAVGQ